MPRGAGAEAAWDEVAGYGVLPPRLVGVATGQPVVYCVALIRLKHTLVISRSNAALIGPGRLVLPPARGINDNDRRRLLGAHLLRDSKRNPIIG